MRVLVIAHSGVLATFRQRWERMADRGHAVTLLCPETWTEGNRTVALEPGGTSELEVLPRQPRGDFWPSPRTRNLGHYYPGLPELLREREPEVLEVFEEPYSLCAWHALRAAQREVPDCLRALFSAQNIEKRYPPPFSWFESSCLARADVTYPVDPLVVPVLRAKGYQGPAPVVPLGIDPTFFRPVPPEPELLPEAAREGPVVGFLGKLQPEKGILDLVEAAIRSRSRPHLVVAGSGPLEEEVRRAGAALGGRLHLLGPLPQPRLPALMATMDLVCVPSRTTRGWMEQFGRVAVEAMACGRPTLVSDSGSLPHVGRGGAEILPEADPVAWAAAFDRLLPRPEARAALGEAGRAHVREHYTWEAVARCHEAAWELAREARNQTQTD